MIEKYFQKERSSTVIANMQMGSGVIPEQLEEIQNLTDINNDGKSRVDILEEKVETVESHIDSSSQILGEHSTKLGKHSTDLGKHSTELGKHSTELNEHSTKLSEVPHIKPVKHYANVRCIWSDGHYAHCSFTIPKTASKLKVEMWGPGARGANACCCSMACSGGQGGDYGLKRFDISSWDSDVVACACMHGCCCTGYCCGSVQESTCSTFCANSKIPKLIVKSGRSGCSVCNYRACCQPDKCVRWDTSRLTNFAKFHKSPVNYSQACGDFFRTKDSERTFQEIVDDIFVPVNCSCFDEYRRGACGFSRTPSHSESATVNYGFCRLLGGPCGGQWGIGGASYRGGDIQTVKCGSCGGDGLQTRGNFPGGGGGGAGNHTNGVTCSGPGASGLIKVSWE